MPSSDDLATSGGPQTTAKPASLWEDFIDIFVSPSEVFERRRDSGFFLALVILTVIIVAITIVGLSSLRPIFDATFDRTMAAAAQKNPGVNADQMATMKAVSGKMYPVIVGAGAFFGPLIVGVVLWLVGKLVSAGENIGAACV